jgi:hypothetical protein
MEVNEYLVKFADGLQVHALGLDPENAQENAIAWAGQLGIVHASIVSITRVAS